MPVKEANNHVQQRFVSDNPQDMSNPAFTHSFSPGVLSLLPMIYVGWSDSVLSPSEMKMIDERIRKMPFLKEEDKRYLCSVIDPAVPPDSAVFKKWLKAIKEHASTLSFDKRMTLMDLGLAIAKSSTGTDQEPFWEADETLESLVELGTALGVNTSLSTEMMTAHLHPQAPGLVDEETREVVNVLKSLLDGPHQELMNDLRHLLRDPFFTPAYVADKTVHRKRTYDQVAELALRGFSRYAFPEKYGGTADASSAIAVFETLAYGDLSTTVKFGVQFGLFGGALFQLGTEKHHRRYLEATIRGDLMGCFAMTETGHGSNVKDLETTAIFDQPAGELVIHSPSYEAGKEYIGNALDSRMAVVFAQLVVGGKNRGIHAVLVPMRDQDHQLLTGITVEDSGYKMGLNGVDNGRIWFDQVRVPVDNLLDRFGMINRDGQYSSPIANPSKRFFTMLGTLVMGRISVGLAAVSASKKALYISGRYGLRRRQFAPGPKQKETLLMDYPSHQHRLLPLLSATYAYHFALRDLVRRFDSTERDDDLRFIETLAAGLKSKASWLCTRSVQESREACGGKGYLTENQIPMIKADADIFTTFEGDNTVLMQLVAKGLLSEFKQSFHDEGFRAVMRFLATRMRHSLNEVNPLQKRNTDFHHLIDPKFHRYALNYRYEKMMLSISQRMRRFLRQGMAPYQTFLKTQVHMINLSHSFVDFHVYSTFDEVVQSVTEPEVKRILTIVLQIHGLSLLIENNGWYLENDFIEGSKSKALRRAQNKLFHALRPDISTLLEAFSIPPELVAAPIAEW